MPCFYNAPHLMPILVASMMQIESAHNLKTSLGLHLSPQILLLVRRCRSVMAEEDPGIASSHWSVLRTDFLETSPVGVGHRCKSVAAAEEPAVAFLRFYFPLCCHKSVMAEDYTVFASSHWSVLHTDFVQTSSVGVGHQCKSVMATEDPVIASSYWCVLRADILETSAVGVRRLENFYDLRSPEDALASLLVVFLRIPSHQRHKYRSAAPATWPSYYSMARKTRGCSKTPLLAPQPLCPSDEGGDEAIGIQVGGGGRYVSPPPTKTSTRLRSRIKPTMRAAEFVHQTEQRRAQMAIKKDSTISSVASSDKEPDIPPSSHDVATPTRAPFPSLPLVDSQPAQMAAKKDSATPSSVVPSVDEPDIPLLPHVTTPTRAPSPALPFVDSQPAGPSHVVEAQIDPILLALSTAVTFDLEMAHESNDDTPPLSQPRRPSTHVIPVPADHDLNSHPTTLTPADSEDAPSTPTSGRRTARVNSILTACYEELDKIITKAVGETSLSVQQVLDSWNKSRGRVIGATNHWNLWPSYLAKHEVQERRRAGIPMDDVPMTPSLRSHLYTKFKEAHPENWQEILEVHNMLQLSELSSSTVAQRTQMFHKIRRQTTSLLDATATKYGFEAAVVMCGNTVNEDASLAFTHTTAGAKMFFETRCRADTDTIIGHLKSHVYNNVSLAVVSDVFDDEGDDGKQQELPIPAPTTGIPGNSKSGVCSDMEDVANDKTDATTSSDDVLAYIKDKILQLIETAGGDMSRIKRNNFPWALLVHIFADQGLVMQGWPSSVLMPGELRTNHSRAKGITILKVHERRDLYNSLQNNEITIVKVEGKVERKALQDSESPTIIGAPPHADSNLTNAPRMYLDGSIDFEGPGRLPPSNAATHVKRKARATADDPIVLSSGDDSGAVIKPAKKLKSAVATKAAVRKKMSAKQKGKARYIPADDSSDDDAAPATDSANAAPPADTPPANTSPAAADVAPRMNANASPESEDDYHAPGPSGKRKASAMVGSHTSKKPVLDLQVRVPDRHKDDVFAASPAPSQAVLDPASPSPKRHVPLTPLIESQDEGTISAVPSSTTTSDGSPIPQFDNPVPALVLRPSVEGGTLELHDRFLPSLPAPRDRSLPPKPVHYQGFAGRDQDNHDPEGSRGVGYPFPAQRHPFPLQNQFHAAGYPFQHFPYQAGDMNLYHGDARGVYGGFHPRDAALLGPGMFPGIPPYADHPDRAYHNHMHPGPARPMTRSPSVGVRQLHHPSADPKLK